MYIKDYSPNTYHILSKMVCKHQSEWSYSGERIKEDAKTFFKEGVFWYFEPFAWVTQMMKIFKWDFKTEEMDGLLNSPTSVYSF